MFKAFSRMAVTGLGVVALAGAITLRAAVPSPILLPPSSFPKSNPQSSFLNPHSPSPILLSQAPAIDAAALYKLHCQVCHGANGNAPLPEMAFVGREWKHGTSSVQMAKIIAEGVKGTPMMPFKGKLKPEQITALAKHIRTFDKRLKPEKP